MSKYPKQFKITPPVEAEGSFEKLAKIAKRENKSMTKIVVELVEKYVNLHGESNNQQTLDVIRKIGHAYHAETCQLCKAKPVHFGLKGDVWLGFCGVHWEPNRFRTWK